MYLIWLKVNWLAPLLEMSALTDEAQLTTNENNWGQQGEGNRGRDLTVKALCVNSILKDLLNKMRGS